MERLSPMDVSFLDQEKRGSHMHIGAVMTFEGPPPSHEDLRAHIESRLHLVPRYRQKLIYPRLEMGRPLWVDDPRFNLDYHVRHTALPSPGSEEQLRMLTGRLFSQRLDRSKPLWELWLVQGLEDNRFAVINKTHHCLVDGVSGVDITTVLFDTSPTPTPIGAGALDAGGPEPSDATLVAEGSGGHRAVPGAARAPRAPCRTPSDARRSTSCARRSRASATSRGSSRTRRPRRRSTCRSARTGACSGSACRSTDLKSIKNELGGTVNDVFLAVVSGALGPHAEAARCAHRGPRAARHRPGVGPRGRPARRARQPHHGDARAAARVRAATRSSACAS